MNKKSFINKKKTLYGFLKKIEKIDKDLHQNFKKNVTVDEHNQEIYCNKELLPILKKLMEG